VGVAAGVEFTHGVTLTQTQLSALGSRNVSLSATSTDNDITYRNIRIIRNPQTSSSDEYSVTINGGGDGAFASPNEAEAGQTVNINAGARNGFTFVNWTSTLFVNFANANSTQTSFVMPASAVALTANWEANVTVLRGDANGDGEVNAADVTDLRRYLAGDVVDGFNQEAADINGDGAVDAADVTDLRRYLAGETIF